MSIEIPKIRDFKNAVDTGIGQKTEVMYGKAGEKVWHSSFELVDDVVSDVFSQEQLPNDIALERICKLVARVAIGRLAHMDELQIRTDHETIDITLREPQATQAKVVTTPE